MKKAGLVTFVLGYLVFFALVFGYLLKSPGQTAAVAGSIATSSPAAGILSDATTTADAGTTVPEVKAFEYKTLSQPDPCTLNKLGSQGWRAVQFDGTLIQAGGLDEACARTSTYLSLEWVLMQRDIPTTTDDGTLSPPTAAYQYKIVRLVDPCTLNQLGKVGWNPVSYGLNPDTNGYVQVVGGKDETCSRVQFYKGFFWILFERTVPVSN